MEPEADDGQKTNEGGQDQKDHQDEGQYGDRFGGLGDGVRHQSQVHGDGQQARDGVPDPLPGVRRQQEHHTVKENQQDHWNEEVDDEEGGSALQVQLEVDVFERSVPDPLGGRVVQNPFPVFCEVVQLDVVFNDEELEFTVSIVPWNHHNGTHLPVEWKVCDVNVT